MPDALILFSHFHDSSRDASDVERKVIEKCWEVYKRGPDGHGKYQDVHLQTASAPPLSPSTPTPPPPPSNGPPTHIPLPVAGSIPSCEATYIPDPDDTDAFRRDLPGSYTHNDGGAPFPLLHETSSTFYIDTALADASQPAGQWYFDFGHNTIARQGGGVDTEGAWKMGGKELRGRGQWKNAARPVRDVAVKDLLADHVTGEPVSEGCGVWQFWRWIDKKNNVGEWMQMDFTDEVYERLEHDFCRGACQLTYTYSYHWHRLGTATTPNVNHPGGHMFYIEFAQTLDHPQGKDGKQYMRQVDHWYPKDQDREKAVRRVGKRR